MKETTKPMASTIQCWVFMTNWRRVCAPAAVSALLGWNRLEQIPGGGGDHGGDGEQEAELERGGAVEPDHLAGGDGGHGARGAGKDGRKRLAEADPDGLAEGHLFDVQRVGLVAGRARIDDPHDDAAEEQRPGHDGDAAEMLLAQLVQRQREDGGEDEGDEGERDGMVDPGAIAALRRWGKLLMKSTMRSR